MPASELVGRLWVLLALTTEPRVAGASLPPLYASRDRPEEEAAAAEAEAAAKADEQELVG